jgi:3-oxoacyl-[acyl-carrier protein] reductase
LNLTTTFLATKAAVPHMNNGGSIVNLSSQAARDGGGSGASAYAASKGGVLSFTKAMAKELGRKNIRVNAVSAGIINTSFHDKFTKPEVRKTITGNSPLGREGEADEVADLVCFLASEESSYINGASVEINGGLYMI